MHRLSPKWLVVLASLLFIPGLTGPFLLDDLPNLEPIRDWVEGRVGLEYVLAQANAGPLGRPASLLSFALTAATTGFTPFGFKATNLCLHLINGLLAGLLLARCFRRFGQFPARPTTLAWIAAAAWVALPLHVPIVLYAVQRMTLLSGTFALLALLAWISARERLQQESGNRTGLVLLWLGVPLLTLASGLAKENGLLVPLLCGVLEGTLFRQSPSNRRPVAATWFVRLFVILPVLVGALFLATHPAYVLGGYQDRPFDFLERLLSQPRALWDYALLTIVPSAGKLGLYQDTFAASTGLLSPPTTLVAIAAWLAVVGLGVAWRQRLPGFAAGIFFFLAGHAMESSVLALELFFIHRNYLPSLGIVMALSALLAAAWQSAGAGARKLLPVLLGTVLAAWAMTTALRAWVWGDEARLITHELVATPDSLRLRSDLAANAIAAGQLEAALVHLRAAEAIAPPEEQRAVRIWKLLAYCSSGRQAPKALLDSLRDGESQKITPYTMRAVTILADTREAGACPSLQGDVVADNVAGWLSTAPRPPSDPLIWRTRYAVARLQGSSGDLPAAQAAALRAFEDSNHAFPVGVLAFQLSGSLGDNAAQERVFEALLAAPRTGDPREAQAMDAFAHALGRSRP